MEPPGQKPPTRSETRREFIKKTAATAALVAGGPLLGSPVFAQGSGANVAIMLGPGGKSIENASVRWAEKQVSAPKSPEFRRLAVDVAVQCGVGMFFAHKFRAAVLFALYDGSGQKVALEESIKAYRSARAAWAAFSEKTKGVYADDITFGFEKQLRGSWSDRLAAIDEDIADLEKRLAALSAQQTVASKFDLKSVQQAIQTVLTPPPRPTATVAHTPQKSFRRAEKINIEANVRGQAEIAATLHFRRVNQAEAWHLMKMTFTGDQCAATIPAEYADSPSPLQYYFQFQQARQDPWLHPGLGRDHRQQPYYVIRQSKEA